MAVEQVEIKLKGLRPLLLVSDVLADPLAVEAKALKRVTGKQIKTEDDWLEIAKLEWHASIYYDPEVGPVVPTWNVVQSLRAGASMFRKGAPLERGLVALEEYAPLEYPGPRDLKGLWDAKAVDGSQLYVDRRTIGIGTGKSKRRTPRVRPRFDTWTLEFSAVIDTSQLEVSDVRRAGEMAGNLVGLGNFRPRFGRYDSTVTS